MKLTNSRRILNGAVRVKDERTSCILLQFDDLLFTVNYYPRRCDGVRWRGYSDHFVTMCVCVWVCTLAR